MDDYPTLYAALGITSDTDWETLRARFQRLISQWHPDRFSDDPTGRAFAEERSKEIIAAYQALGKYRQEHGVLPPLKSRADTAGQELGRELDSPPQSSTAEPAPSRPDMAAGVTSRSTARYWRRAGVALFIAFPVVFFADHYRTRQDPEEPPADSILRSTEPEVTAPSDSQPRRESNRWIWIGSTVGDVYAAQGIPTSTDRNVWNYGKSEIRFAQGKVVSWIEHPDSPLRIARNQRFQIREGTFDMGSSKDEVLAIQGIPVTETDTVWDYGLSRVYFRDNRVVRWEESPMQLLRVHH